MKKNKICKVCKKKFEGYAWFHCPKCGQHGLASIYEPTCTACANVIRYEKHQLSRQYYPDMDREFRPIKSEKPWWKIW